MVPRILRVSLFLLAIVVATPWRGAAQTSTFHATTALVPVFATVTDEHDRPVFSLTADSFQVFDDGKRQSLVDFEHGIQPLALIVMLDTSASMTPVLDDVKAAAEQFVIRLLPTDTARVGAFNDRIQLMSEFTNDRDVLARAARDVDFGNYTRLYDAAVAGLDALRDGDGRKVLVILSDGDDTDSRARRQTVIARARAENVMVYSIGFESQYRDEDDDEIVVTEPDPALRKLADDTGGRYIAVKHSRDLGSTFTSILEELHSQYLLAFAPEVNDGRVHHLDVRTVDKNFTVRARRSYTAAPNGTTDHVR